MKYKEVQITPEEREKMDEAKRAAVFQAHPKFAGVEIAPLTRESLPAAILHLIDQTRFDIFEVGAVRAFDRIPEHIHELDEEICFNGDGRAIVSLILKGKAIMMTRALDPNFVAHTEQGEGHGVEVSGVRPNSFMYVKFKPKSEPGRPGIV